MRWLKRLLCKHLLWIVAAVVGYASISDAFRVDLIGAIGGPVRWVGGQTFDGSIDRLGDRLNTTVAALDQVLKGNIDELTKRWNASLEHAGEIATNWTYQTLTDVDRRTLDVQNLIEQSGKKGKELIKETEITSINFFGLDLPMTMFPFVLIAVGLLVAVPAAQLIIRKAATAPPGPLYQRLKHVLINSLPLILIATVLGTILVVATSLMLKSAAKKNLSDMDKLVAAAMLRGDYGAAVSYLEVLKKFGPEHENKLIRAQLLDAYTAGAVRQLPKLATEFRSSPIPAREMIAGIDNRVLDDLLSLSLYSAYGIGIPEGYSHYAETAKLLLHKLTPMVCAQEPSNRALAQRDLLIMSVQAQVRAILDGPEQPRKRLDAATALIEESWSCIKDSASLLQLDIVLLSQIATANRYSAQAGIGPVQRRLATAVDRLGTVSPPSLLPLKARTDKTTEDLYHEVRKKIVLTKALDALKQPPDYYCGKPDLPDIAVGIIRTPPPPDGCTRPLERLHNTKAIEAWKAQTQAYQKQISDADGAIRTLVRKNAEAIENIVTEGVGAGAFARVYSRQLALDNVKAGADETELDWVKVNNPKGVACAAVNLGYTGVASLIADGDRLRMACGVQQVDASDLTRGYLKKVLWNPQPK